MTDYPEHEKLKAISDKSQAVYDFINWLDSKDYLLCVYIDDAPLTPVSLPMMDLLSEFFDIDQNTLENEKEQMLKEIRDAQ